MIEQLLKALTLTIAAGFLYVFWEHRDNGRFILHPEGGAAAAIFDTRTGSIFGCTSEGSKWSCVEINPRNAEVDFKPIPPK